MSIRIPRPVNRTLDVLSRHRLPASVIAIAAIAAATTAWSSTTGLLIATIGLTGFVAASFHVAQVTTLREALRQRDYDNAALRAENEQLRMGDGSAPTAQLRTIGGTGEAT